MKRDYRKYSYWLDACDEDLDPRPPLDGSVDVDIAILRAGFTGLWTEWYLQDRDPSLNIAIVEQAVAGFGASGRNGGATSANLAVRVLADLITGVNSDLSQLPPVNHQSPDWEPEPLRWVGIKFIQSGYDEIKRLAERNLQSTDWPQHRRTDRLAVAMSTIISQALPTLSIQPCIVHPLWRRVSDLADEYTDWTLRPGIRTL